MSGRRLHSGREIFPATSTPGGATEIIPDRSARDRPKGTLPEATVACAEIQVRRPNTSQASIAPANDALQRNRIAAFSPAENRNRRQTTPARLKNRPVLSGFTQKPLFYLPVTGKNKINSYFCLKQTRRKQASPSARPALFRKNEGKRPFGLSGNESRSGARFAFFLLR